MKLGFLRSIIKSKIDRNNLYLTVLASLLLVILHVSGIKYDLYYLFSFYDLVLHFLGGLTLGLFFGTLIGFVRRKLYYSLTIVFVLFIGWEIFEVIYDIAGGPEEIYWLDTIIDIIMDTAGLLLAMFLVKKEKY